MRKNLLLLGACLLGTIGANAQQSAQVRVKSGYTADVVAEAMPAADHLVQGIDNAAVGLMPKRVIGVNHGLPSDSRLVSAENGNVYQIDYTKNNALRLVGPNDDPNLNLSDEAELTLATPVKTSKLWMLCICGNGPTDLEVEVTYSDGNIDYGTITVEDWWNESTNPADHVGKSEAFWGLDRIDRNNNLVQGTTAVRILEKSIDTNPEKEIVSIFIGKTDASKGYPTIFGFSAGSEPIKIAEGFNADIVAEAYPIGEHATVSLDRNAWVIYSESLGDVYMGNNNGLPEDGNLVTKSGRTYHMDYANLNATRLTADDANTADIDESIVTLELEDHPKLSDDGKLIFLATAGNGPAELDIEYTYEDESTYDSHISVLDWCNHQSEAAIQTGRYYEGKFDDRDYVGLYEIEDYPDTGKAIKSISFYNTSGGASKGIIVGIYMNDGTLITGIDSIKNEDKASNGKIYNLAGQRVNSTYKGIVIRDGKKMIMK
ncbi:MAG: hypothetical protein ACI3YB_01425 [Prevotella sp.]